MYDEAHIGLVDAHAEGDGSHDDIYLLHEEVILSLRAQGRLQSCMVAGRLDIVGTQNLRQVLHLLPRQTIDDAALTRVLLHETDDVLVYLARLRSHLIVEVRTVERALELHGIEDAQVLLDVRPHLVSSRCREGDDRSLTNLVDDRAYATILRTEVVSPLRDTMGLVDGIERYLHRLQELHIVLLRQRLGGYIQQFGDASTDVGLHLVDGPFVQRRVQVVGGALLFAEVTDDVHLVLHECYEGTDDDGHTVHQQRGQLIAQ